MASPLNKFKQISLVFASLFILALATFGQSLNLNKASFQNKNEDQCISAFLVDDLDDDIDTEQVSSFHQLHFIQLPTPFVNLQDQSFTSVAPRSSSPIPFYLKIQNLRI